MTSGTTKTTTMSLHVVGIQCCRMRVLWSNLRHGSRKLAFRSFENKEMCTATTRGTRYLVSVQYDGQNSKEDAIAFEPNVVRALKRAIEKLVGRDNYSNFKATSRTDAGVHGVHNTFHVDLVRRKRQTMDVSPSNFSTEEVLNGINFYLNNPAITITHCIAVKNDFDARKRVESRTYLYRIICPRNRRKNLLEKNQPIKSKSMYQRHYAWITRWHLDTEKMKQATQHLIGRKDFSVFACSGCQSPSPWKTVYSIEISERINHDSNIHDTLHDNDVEITIAVTADSFLYKMVRNMVGILVKVGRGKMDPNEIKDVIDKKQIKEVRRAVLPPPNGLYLMSVNYNQEVLEKYRLEG